MLIQILNITKTPATSKAGKPYTFLDIAYKNLTFQGKVEGKKLMPFGDNANATKALENAASGDVYDISVVKNGAGFNDWIAAVPSTAGATSEAPPAASYTPKAASGSAPARSSYETPEERAQKQVYIIRQSNISSAINLLSVGAKTAPKLSEVLDTAKELEKYVFGIVPDGPSGFDSMTDDLPE